MQQHAQPVDAAIAAAAGGRQQVGLERRVDDVVHRRRMRQAREVEVERRLALHAERGGVDQQGRVLEGLRPVVPAIDQICRPSSGVKATPRSTAELCVRLTSRSSGTPAPTRVATIARAAPPAPSTTTGPASAANGGALLSASMKPKPSLLRPSRLPIGLLDHGVHCADMDRRRIDAIEHWHDPDLVRQGEVAAARVGRAPQERHQLLQRRTYWARPAGARSGRRACAASARSRAGRASVNARPASRRCRRTAGRVLRQELVVRAHAACSRPMPCCARKESSGSSGRPRMVKSSPSILPKMRPQPSSW